MDNQEQTQQLEPPARPRRRSWTWSWLGGGRSWSDVLLDTLLDSFFSWLFGIR